MPAAHHRRALAMRMLRRGQVTITEAAQIALVSRQRVRVWCEVAGIDPVAIRRAMIAQLIAELDNKEATMDKRRGKPTEDKRRHAGMMAPLLRSTPRPKGPSKDAMRDESERLVAEFKAKRSAR